jgi:hypothetical protein
MKSSLPAVVLSAFVVVLTMPGTGAGQAASSSSPGPAAVPSTAEPSAQTGTITAKPTPETAAAKPAEKVGFARVAPGWPRWFTLILVDRSRVESIRPPGTRGAEYDTYALNRFRLTASARTASWLTANLQVQDARVGGYATSPAPKSVQNTLDLRLANVELGRKGARGVTAVVGRQELSLGDGRLMASPDWGNVSRTYDGLRVSGFLPGFKVDVFGVAPVDVTPDSFSKAKYGERAFGAWSTLDKVKPLAYIDVYELVKHNSAATGETGSKGDQTIYATGVRVGGPIGKAFSWEADNAIQRGHSAGDDVKAWATHEGVSWTIGRAAWKPKLGVDYDFASGDDDPKDGVKGTFDQLYASTHGKWGLGDQVGWRNMHHVALRLEVSPTRNLKVSTAVNKIYLATLNDAWYSASGSKVVINRTATSRDVGWEPDLSGTCTLTRDLTMGIGLAVLLGGDFVKQSTDVQRVWTPYVMWTYRF